jgi:DNA-binding transcriptional LysR family regulator
MDSVSQERALLEGRISVGILVPSDRPVLELLKVRLLIKYLVSLALPKSHPHANKPEIPLSLLKEEPFIGLNRMQPNYGDWLLKACRRAGSSRESSRKRTFSANNKTRKSLRGSTVFRSQNSRICPSATTLRLARTFWRSRERTQTNSAGD